MRIGDVDIGYIIAVYGFVLPVGYSTAKEFAQEIARVYSSDEPRNKEAIEFVQSLEGAFYCSRTGIGVVYLKDKRKVHAS